MARTGKVWVMQRSFICKDTGIPWDVVVKVIRSFERFIVNELSEGREVRLDGVGIFFLKKRNARTTKTSRVFIAYKKVIKTEPIERHHPEAMYVKFKAFPALKKAVWEKQKPIYKSGQTPH